MKKQLFGRMPGGEEIFAYTLQNENARVKILNLGGVIQAFEIFGRDIVAGFDTVEDYLADDSHQGGIIGRVCNRIRDARFTLNGKVYQLTSNVPGGAQLHGGNIGFDRRVWTVDAHTSESITLSLTSPDGEEGYPATMQVKVVYSLVGTALKIDYRAEADDDTVVNLTNHAYFHLGGYGNGDILDHVLYVNADTYTELDETLVSTGRTLDVENSVFDFRTPHKIGDEVRKGFAGYDVNYQLKHDKVAPVLDTKLPFVASLEAAGLKMNVYTDRPCVQLYIGNFLEGLPNMKGGAPKAIHSTVCLETQEEPNGVNLGRSKLLKGEVFESTTVYELSQI